MKSSSFIAVFFVAFLTVSCIGQGIDNLKTKQDIQSFIQKNVKGYQDFEVNIYIKDKKVKEYISSIKMHDYYKVDFDLNGYTDLLVTGTKDGYAQTIVLMSDSQKTFKPFELLSNWNIKWLMPLPVVKLVNGQPLIFLQQVYIDSSENQHLSIRYSDTLVFKWGQFINYNTAYKFESKKISSLIYQTRPTWKGSPFFQFTIDSLGNATLNAVANNKDLNGQYSYKFNNLEFRLLTDIINYVNLFRYKEDYSVGVTDQALSEIKVVFSDNSEKYIKDYGQNGGFGLSFLYRYFSGFRYSKNWHR